MSVFTNPASASKEHAAAYTAALLELLGDQSPHDVLWATQAEIVQRIVGVPPESLTRPEAPGKWSIRHVLQHLADSELVFGFRLRMILSQDRPALVGYDQDAFAERLRYEQADAEEALQLFGVLRLANLRLLDRASPDELKRVGVHAERGEESIEHLMKLYAAHDLLHLNQIDRVLETITLSP